MKSIAGSLRLDLAQYRELAAFAQFGSDLDKATQRQLARGERLMEILKQGQYKPLPVELQIVSIFAGTKGLMDRVKVSAIGALEPRLHQAVRDEVGETLDTILETGKLSDESAEKLTEVINSTIDAFLREHPEAALG